MLDEQRDPFPVGMRVLAVDDDPTCLKILEGLLRRCRYHVTTTFQAINALKMLRENKGMFDLVISDVHMPDMDGFKLLELVGLEMDLPVIMLSVNGETSAVMKGITHGAVDYLLKPVRIEELKNIWQHVVRRRRFDKRDLPTVGPSEGNNNLKVCKKRKEQNDQDEDDGNDNSNENESFFAQKKSRVVWSVELHRKFVSAVNQLGIDKAVPKRILDLMNVERLTRENVASHLQKYRLYLKRISSMPTQKANLVSAYGGRDVSQISIGLMNTFGSYQPLQGSMQLTPLSPLQPNDVQKRQCSNSLGLQFLNPPEIVHFDGINSTSNPLNEFRKLQGFVLPINQTGNLQKVQSRRQKSAHEARNVLSSCLSNGFSTESSNNSANSTNMGLLPSHHSDPFKLSSSDICRSAWEDFTSSLDPFAIRGSGIPKDPKLSDFGRSKEIAEGDTLRSNLLSSISGSWAPPGNQTENQRLGAFCTKKQAFLLHQSSFSSKHLAHHSVNDEPGLSSAVCGLDDLANAIKQEREDAAFMEGSKGFDLYSMGTCL